MYTQAWQWIGMSKIVNGQTASLYSLDVYPEHVPAHLWPGVTCGLFSYYLRDIIFRQKLLIIGTILRWKIYSWIQPLKLEKLFYGLVPNNWYHYQWLYFTNMNSNIRDSRPKVFCKKRVVIIDFLCNCGKLLVSCCWKIYHLN